MTRDSHFEGVGFAGIAVQELQNVIAVAREQQQQVLGMVIAAVGESPVVDSAQNAVSYAAAIGDQLDDLAGVCEHLKAELNRYSGGF